MSDDHKVDVYIVRRGAVWEIFPCNTMASHNDQPHARIRQELILDD